MSPAEAATLGERLDHRARAVMARRDEPARRVARLGTPDRRWDAPGRRRLRVEADVPSVWEDEPPFGVPAAAVSSVRLPEARRVAAADPPAAEDESHLPTTPSAVPVRGLPFPADLGERLRTVVGPGIERVQLHDGDADPAADEVARSHDAAAVTVGQQIFLRQGRFRPSSPEGRGLLAHEAVHAVLGGRPGAGWRRATAAGRAQEEQLARAVGAAVAGTGPSRASAGTPPATGHSAVAGGMASPTATGDPTGTARVVPSVHVGGSWLGRAVPGPADPPAPGRTADSARTTVIPGRRLLAHEISGASLFPGRSATTRAASDGPGGPVRSRRSQGRGASPDAPAAGATPTSTAASTGAASAPMAAPATGTVDSGPGAAAVPTVGSDRESMLHELMRQVRTDRERGA